jgi:phosphatidylglycerophosphatase A
MIEKLNAGFGIMLDDVVAGIFAGIVLHVIYYRFLS